MESARCKAFMYAADTGSFTKAAERLNYTPSGVSQLVGALENETGLTLLRRTRKGVTLTPDGEILLPAVREFLEKEENIEPEEIKIIRTKEIEMKPMYPEDACIQMELLGHSFFVFCNAETDQVNVVYKRKGNTYGLIEPEL